MKGQWINVGSADEAFGGYLATPASGSGPGIVLLQEIFGVNDSIRSVADLYAEEGYVVFAPDLFWRIEPRIQLGYGADDTRIALGYFERLDIDLAVEDCRTALEALRARPECTGGVGALGFCLGGTLSYLMAARTDVDCAVAYYPVGVPHRLGEAAKIRCPIALHFAGRDRMLPPEARATVLEEFAKHPKIKSYVYPESDHAFAAPAREEFDRAATRTAHTRSLAIFRRVLGPDYDLDALWERHIGYEFVTRSAADTMKTMIDQPYVNEVPLNIGGVGPEDLYRFYNDFFIPQQPADTKLIPISRTIGVDQVVDEFVFCFTHDIEMDWMLPGIPPTGKYVEVPQVVIIRFRGDKLCHEHLYWDQASVLKQIGVLDGDGLPITGAESARKVLDERVRANDLMRNWAVTEQA